MLYAFKTLVDRPTRCPRGHSYLQVAMLPLVFLGLQLVCANARAADAFVRLSLRAYPEVLRVNEGDTVVFVWSYAFDAGVVESYNGEWRSAVLQSGDMFSHTFAVPGTYVYRIQTGVSTNPVFSPGVIKVQGISSGYPAVWISRPLDNFTVPGYTDIEAATTNSPDSVKSINFYADGQYLGGVTNPPYVFTAITNLGTYNFTVSVVDAAGQTNLSAPVRITFDNQIPFGLWRLPEGQTVFFKSAAGSIYCIEWSQDLQKWWPRTLGQQWGSTVIVDETTTNANIIQRFYRIVDCL